MAKIKSYSQTGADEETRQVLSRASDLYTKASRTGRPFYTKFLTPAEAMAVIKHMPQGDIAVESHGGYDDAERVVIAFVPQWQEAQPPITVLHIHLKGKGEVNHRDYLGTVLSLGLKRDTVGDIIVREGEAYMFCLDEIAAYICDNLTKISGIGSTVTVCDKMCEMSFERSYITSHATVSSLRADCVVSALCSKSRSAVMELFNRGLVSINYTQATSTSRTVNDNDVITVRGYGKFKISVSDQLTKKGRIHIEINKYA